MQVSLRPYNKHDSVLILNPDLLNNFGLENLLETKIHFGKRLVEVTVISSDKVKEDEMLLSSNIISDLKIIHTVFDIVVTDNELFIGPYIGIVGAQTRLELESNLNNFSSFIHHYDKFKGAIILFSLEDVNRNTNSINGYMYNPKLKIWVLGTYGFPSSLIRRTILNKDWREYFTTILGNAIFNYRIINKWEIHQKLASDKDINKFLPYTKFYKEDDDIFTALTKYESIYLKPIHGSYGSNIIKIMKRKKESFALKSSSDNKELLFSNKTKLSNYIKSNLDISQYVIQQGLLLNISNNGIIDFRITLDKDGDGNWKNTIIVGRIGLPEGIVSNRSNGGEVHTYVDILKSYYHFSDDEINETTKEFISISTRIAKSLESKGGHFGKLAIDLAIDSNMKIWLIEVNNNFPNDFIGDNIGDIEAGKQIRLLNMLYAKKLAGFTHNSSTTPIMYNNKNTQNQHKIIVRVLIYAKCELEQLVEYIQGCAGKLNIFGWMGHNIGNAVHFELEGYPQDLETLYSELNINSNIEVELIAVTHQEAFSESALKEFAKSAT